MTYYRIKKGPMREFILEWDGLMDNPTSQCLRVYRPWDKEFDSVRYKTFMYV